MTTPSLVTPLISPAPSTGPDIWPLIIKDMSERHQFGIDKYNMPLRANNGRDALVDAYQEALDLVAYLRTAIEERNSILEKPQTETLF